MNVNKHVCSNYFNTLSIKMCVKAEYNFSFNEKGNYQTKK